MSKKAENTEENKALVKTDGRKPLDQILPSVLHEQARTDYGRKSKLTKAMITKIAGYIEDCMPYKGAASLAGIHSVTLYRYLGKGNDDLEAGTAAGYTDKEITSVSDYALLVTSLAHADNKAQNRLIKLIEQGASGRSVKCPHCMKVFKLDGDWRAAESLTKLRWRDQYGKSNHTVKVDAQNVQFQLNYQAMDPKVLDE